MFSATFARDVEEWCKLNLDNVIQVGNVNMTLTIYYFNINNKLLLKKKSEIGSWNQLSQC